MVVREDRVGGLHRGQLDENTAFNSTNNPVFLDDGTFPVYTTVGKLNPEAQWTGIWVNFDRAP